MLLYLFELDGTGVVLIVVFLSIWDCFLPCFLPAAPPNAQAELFLNLLTPF